MRIVRLSLVVNDQVKVVEGKRKCVQQREPHAMQAERCKRMWVTGNAKKSRHDTKMIRVNPRNEFETIQELCQSQSLKVVANAKQ